MTNYESMMQYYHCDEQMAKYKLQEAINTINDLFYQEIGECLKQSVLIVEDDKKISCQPHMVSLLETLNNLKILLKNIDSNQFISLENQSK